MKKCTKCRRELDESEFGRRKTGKNGKNSVCKTCNNLKSKLYKSGLTHDEYLNLVEHQTKDHTTRCAICYSSAKLFIDHDHESGIVRGLLCPNCSSAIGAFKDDISLLNKALAYVRLGMLAAITDMTQDDK